MHNRGVFADIYRNGGWGTGSGPGSTPDATAIYRGILDGFLRANDVKSVIDIGCGDWQFSRLINWYGANYVGYDVVPTLIEENSRRFGQANVRFLDMPEDYDEIVPARDHVFASPWHIPWPHCAPPQVDPLSKGFSEGILKL